MGLHRKFCIVWSKLFRRNQSRTFSTIRHISLLHHNSTGARSCMFQNNKRIKSGVVRPEYNSLYHMNGDNAAALLDLYDTFLLDLDGTMWEVDHITPITGISEAVANLRRLNKKLLFVTNNSIHGNSHYTEKFENFGFSADEDDIFGVAHAAAIYIKEILNVNRPVYVIGSYGMEAELEHFGIDHFGVGPDPDMELASWDPNKLFKMKFRDDVGAVLVGFDCHFHYNKIFKATSYLLDKSCYFVATNDVEMGFKLSEKRFQPVTGALVKTVAAASRRDPRVVGKPHPLMLECVKRKHELDLKRTLFIGDSIKADITFANNVGIDSALVLTGVNTEKDLSNHPDDQGETNRVVFLHSGIYPSNGSFNGSVLHAIYQAEFYLDLLKHDVVATHSPGQCILLDGAEGGSEDITTLPDGRTFISSGFFKHRKPKILLFDFLDPEHNIKEIKMESSIGIAPGSFHGLSTWTDPKTGEVTVMVINHANDVTDHVEVFSFNAKEGKLIHVRSITHPLISNLNDLVAIDNTKFYATHMYYWRHDEVVVYPSAGTILFYNGSEARVVSSGHMLPNGINISPDKRFIFVAEFGKKRLIAFTRKADNQIEYTQDLLLDSGVDNIEVDPKTGDLWIGSHPRVYQIIAYDKSLGKTMAPSQVLRVKFKDGKFSDAVEVFLDKGKRIPASTAASVYKNRLLIGSLGGPPMLCDIIHIES